MTVLGDVVLAVERTEVAKQRCAGGKCALGRAIEEGEVVLKLISPLRPGLIESGDESRFRYLIMPIRLNV